ncbi:MAG: lipid-binding SYLF domain-containing protein [Pirellulales bacterium]
MRYRISLLAIVGLGVVVGDVHAQAREEEIVRSATTVLDQTMAMQLEGIPRSLLADARGVAIVPGVIKGGFVVGARYGKGVLLVRDEAGTWRLPSFVTLAGGSFGWQIGVQATDLILIFKTQKSVDGILTGKLTLGADAAVAAGPVGREAAAATDQRLGAEIYTYSRSRGLFAGISLDGSVLRIDQADNALYYPAPGPGQPAATPQSAVLLAQKVASYTSGAVPSPGDTVAPPGPALLPAGGDQAAMIRDQLAHVAPQLYGLLDPQWRAFLALPAEVFQGHQHPPIAALEQSLANFATVQRDPRYAALAARPEFQSTYGLLQHYLQAQSPAAGQLQLPPPPMR